MSQGDVGTDNPLYPFVYAWLQKIDLAQKDKWDKFGKWSSEAKKFFDGSHDFMWDEASSRTGPASFLAAEGNSWKPTFRMTYNRMFEAVALYGPAMYFRNPTIQCTPLESPEFGPESFGLDPEAFNLPPEAIDPDTLYALQSYSQAAGAQAALATDRVSISRCYQAYLNWVQRVGDKKRQTRRAITDALITGAGYLKTTIDTAEASGIRFPRSVYVSSDDILKDPDAEYEEDVQWMAERFILPLNVVEEKYQLPAGSLRGHIESFEHQAESGRGKQRRKDDGRGRSFDLIEGYRIYSKNGFGNLLKGEPDRNGKAANNPRTAYDASWLGRYCHLVVAKGIPYPLNLPPWILQDQEAAFMAAQWDCPFWQEMNKPLAWPFAELRFYDKPGCVWPVSLFKSVAGEMKFINWCMSFLADKAASACQTLLVRAKAAGAEIQKQLAGGDAPFTTIELSDLLGIKPSELLTFIQAPPFPGDIWNVIAAVDEKIDKRLGLTELLYGMSAKQIRTAAEADLKSEQITIRPDDMANNVEDWVSLSVLKEAQAARYHLGGEDVGLVLGPLGAALWDQHVDSTDPNTVVNEYAFRIEAGSTRKPNKAGRVAQLQEFGQYALPVMQQFAAQGMLDPYNAYMTEMAKALDLDPQPFMVRMPEPPPVDPNAPPPVDPAAEAQAQQAEQKLQAEEARLAMDQQRHEQEMAQRSERHELDLRVASEKAKAAKKIGAKK
jgi:hypothetical protein